MKECNRLPVAPNGCTSRSRSERIQYFDVEFAPCDCAGTKMRACDLMTIAVRQRLVVVPFTYYYELWCYGRVCEGCLRAWVTEPRLSRREHGAHPPSSVVRAVAAWWAEQRRDGGGATTWSTSPHDLVAALALRFFAIYPQAGAGAALFAR